MSNKTKGNFMKNTKKMISMILVGVMALSLVACGKKNENKEEAVKDVELSTIHSAVSEAYGDSYYPNMDYDAETLENIFGVKAEWCEEFIAQGPMMSASVDTFLAIKANEGNVQNVVDALQSYRDYLINDSMQYPTNKVKVQASEVKKVGNYVFFILLGEIPMEVEEQGEDAILATAKEQVAIAVNTIDELFK
ncbi:DUF4358 domain-containing protein [Anaerosporobacter faecicola]|uniref:DUF4358 domain-containing protein n=1 Tax=Anaerosporobacter faecicola TaxID=2718714 RepID=UPI00143A8F80|nr:DUF4358 domain-containing protein [Anaerosporobacter faecicola]